VLSLPAGDLGLCSHRRAAAPRPAKVEGIEDVAPPKPGEEDKIYRMEDDLHPRDKDQP
jgi:hypothetical protein